MPPKQGSRIPAGSGDLFGHVGIPGLRLAVNEGLEKEMETTIMGYMGISIRIHSFTPS